MTDATRIGLATGYDPVLGVSEFADAVREIDRRGWEIAFFSETIALMRDSVTALAAFAACTTRVTLGCTQVVRLRSPVLMAPLGFHERGVEALGADEPGPEG